MFSHVRKFKKNSAYLDATLLADLVVFFAHLTWLLTIFGLWLLSWSLSSMLGSSFQACVAKLVFSHLEMAIYFSKQRRYCLNCCLHFKFRWFHVFLGVCSGHPNFPMLFLSFWASTSVFSLFQICIDAGLLALVRLLPFACISLPRLLALINHSLCHTFPPLASPF